jgi:hypothetical protein
MLEIKRQKVYQAIISEFKIQLGYKTNNVVINSLNGSDIRIMNLQVP